MCCSCDNSDVILLPGHWIILGRHVISFDTIGVVEWGPILGPGNVTVPSQPNMKKVQLSSERSSTESGETIGRVKVTITKPSSLLALVSQMFDT